MRSAVEELASEQAEERGDDRRSGREGKHARGREAEGNRCNTLRLYAPPPSNSF